MQDIINQIARARDMARLLGQKECRVASIIVENGRAELRIRYLMGPMHEIRPGDPEDGVTIDMADMPKGVAVLSMQAPPDDVIGLPDGITEDDVRAISAALGRPDITRGDRSDGVTVYWMNPMSDADRIRAVGELLWGGIWQTEMQRALGLSDASTVRKWASGSRHPRQGVWDDLRRVCEARQADVVRAMTLVDEGRG